MKNIIKSIIIACVFISSFAHAEKSPIRLEIEPDVIETSGYDYPVWRYTFISLTDSITIKDVKINRGNCWLSRDAKNIKLKFGESKSLTATTNDSYTKCIPVEVVVETNKGDWVFNP